MTRRRTRRTSAPPRPRPTRSLLTAHGRGLAGLWRTPGVLRTAEGRGALGIRRDERLVALIHLGWPPQEKEPPERAPQQDVVAYLP